MNLGDGLMFELDNGKPKLVLSSYDEPKASSKVGHCQVPYRNRTQKSTVLSKQCPKEPERPQRERKCGDPVGVNPAEKSTAQTRRKTKVKVNKEHSSVIGVVRVQSESKTKTTDETSKVIEKTVKESLVCLTQEQLQQILNSIKASGQDVQDDSKTHVQNGGHAVDTKDQCTSSDTVTSGAAELLLDSSNHRHRSSQGKGTNEKKPSDSTPSGLFGTLGEREREREALEAKRAQWRRELDEQMALKKQQKANTEVTLQSEPTGPRSSDQPGVQDDRISRTGTESTNSRPAPSQTHGSQKVLPSAIRSAFILGEAAPLDHAFSNEKKDQQRRWLQDLEQQREEAKLRKKLEKQSQNQAEDHERWAMHFDSFQRRVPPHPPPSSDRLEPDMGSSLSHRRSPSGALSTAWEAMSAFGGDSMGRASVDTTQGFQHKSSYLRTMTALLDPAQIEERERKRIKQLEHKRAIEAQVEEQRRQKEKEETARQALEQEEERRVARERELLQQQYLQDTQRQRQKEEVQSRKTEELYQSVQKAQEEAQKDKHLQRIRELARKGHDVSNLLRSLEGESASQALRGVSSVSVATGDTAPRVEALHTTRKDTAVQTDVNEVSPPETDVTVTNNGDIQAPAVPAEYRASPNTKRSRREARLAEKNSGKENVFVALREADPYEAYARTDRPHAQQPGRKPEWNTQRPSKPFVPASERYPAVLQRHRQESRMRRQMELMTLVERNAFSKTPQQDPSSRAVNPSHFQRHMHSAHRNGEDSQRAPSSSAMQSRGHSPPVPAVKHRLQQFHQPSPPQTDEPAESNDEWPPSSDYVPYVRTDEVYHLDPLAPISRPPTHEASQKTHADVNSSRQPTPVVQRDPLLHPELLKSTERQQAILKGLSELRQGLLQKQRELESSLNPLLQGQSRNHSPAFQPM